MHYIKENSMVHSSFRLFWCSPNLANEKAVLTHFELYGTYHVSLYLLLLQLSPYHMKSYKITSIFKLFLIVIVNQLKQKTKSQKKKLSR
jgi:hypothetical protein